MSRSLKKSAERGTPGDNPGSEKAGARARPLKRPRSRAFGWIVGQRRRFGATEKILRRNAGLWRRMAAKEGRRVDRAAIRESGSE